MGTELRVHHHHKDVIKHFSKFFEYENDLQDMLENKHQFNIKEPKFIADEKEEVNAARKGTLVHLCFQKLDCKKDYTEEDLKDLIQELVRKNIIRN